MKIIFNFYWSTMPKRKHLETQCCTYASYHNFQIATTQQNKNNYKIIKFTFDLNPAIDKETWYNSKKTIEVYQMPTRNELIQLIVSSSKAPLKAELVHMRIS